MTRSGFSNFSVCRWKLLMKLCHEAIGEMSAGDSFKKVGKRTLLIFLLVWLLNAFPFFDTMRLERWFLYCLDRSTTIWCIAADRFSLFLWCFGYYTLGDQSLGWDYFRNCTSRLLALLIFWCMEPDPLWFGTNAAIKLDLVTSRRKSDVH